MKNRVKVIHGGLLCDNPECNWEDKTIPVEEYETYIDCPCPDCGENILTQHDFDNVKTLLNIVDAVNENIEDFDESEEESIMVRVNTHGTISFEDWVPNRTLRGEFEMETSSTSDKDYIEWLENRLNKKNEG